MEIPITTLIISILQSFVLPFQLFNILSRKFDKARIRILGLTAVFVLFNAAWIFSMNSNVLREIESNLIVIAAGLAVWIYVIKYAGLETKTKTKWNRTSKLLMTGVICIVLYLAQSALLSSHHLKLSLFIEFQILAIINCIMVVRAFFIKKENYQLLKVAILICTGIFLVIPYVLIYVPEPWFKNLVINLIYFILLFAYQVQYLNQSKFESELLLRFGFTKALNIEDQDASTAVSLLQLSLSTRELEIASLILQNYTYKEIAELKFIAEGTVSKHASNIYAKANCPNKKREFLLKYGASTSIIKERKSTS
ncbi:MAG: helix-turn-helix transcriptional regulator [Crocinitomicaceae bacterium]|nr:helix-turn-helix transcriptional regulator [Crocinitomicaceae bacterium]